MNDPGYPWRQQSGFIIFARSPGRLSVNVTGISKTDPSAC
jgi:hypothetical protein